MNIILLEGGAMGTLGNFLFPLAIMAVFYFFFIRPQTQRQKAQDDFTGNLEKGKKVVTSSGLLGTINKVEDQIITLQVDAKTFIKVTRTAISKELTEAVYKNDAKDK